MNSENAINACCVSIVGATTRLNREAKTTIERIPMPEIGLLDAPMSPAMYPHTPAITKPTTSTSGTATSVNFNALGASTVAFAKLNESHAAIARHATVSMRIHVGEMSRSVSSPFAATCDAASIHQSCNNRLGKHPKCVDRCNTDRTGSNEAYLRAPDRCRVRRQCLTDRSWLSGRQNRNCNYPRDDLPDEHRHSHRQTNELTSSEQCERPGYVVSAGCDGPYANEAGQAARDDLRRAHNREACRCYRPEYYCNETFLGLAGFILGF